MEIDPKNALLGTMMFITYDGGHSLHEALWTVNQVDKKLNFGFNLSEKTQSPDNYIGEYLYPSYSFIQAGDGGMEYRMYTLIRGKIPDIDRLLALMFHEAAHSWFQQIATNETMHTWMKVL